MKKSQSGKSKSLACREKIEINPDLIKAMRCLASQDGEGNCFMDKYNLHMYEGRMECTDRNDGSIQCPYHQTSYGVCFEDGDCMEWLNTAADILERVNASSDQCSDLKSVKE